MVFDDPLGQRFPAQTTALADTTKAHVELLGRRLAELDGKIDAVGVALLGETEGLRVQASAVVQGIHAPYWCDDGPPGP